MVLAKQPEVQVLQRSAATPQGLAITHDVRIRQASAEIFARYNLAMMTQRDWVAVEAKLMLDCDNPEFAKEAFYSKPAGRDKIEGLSIRFAERARQYMRNVQVDTSPEMEDDFSVHYRTTVIDLESNIPESETFKVEKTVERRGVNEGDTVISQRTNSSGHTVYLIPATEDQLNTKLRAQISKVKRTLLLALVPADVRSRCLSRCKEVSLGEDKRDPAAATKSIVSAFISIGIDVPDLKDYLGKTVASATPEQVTDLRSIYALIREGEMTWQDVMDAKREREAEQGSKAEFVARKQKERADKKNKRNTTAAAGGNAPAPRRARGAAAAGAAPPPDAAAAAAATNTASTPTDAPPKPRASRRGGDEGAPPPAGGGDTTDPASNSTPA
jgi:hypothetical protein